MHKSLWTVVSVALLLIMSVVNCSNDIVLNAEPVGTGIGEPTRTVSRPPLPTPPVMPRVKTQGERVEVLVLKGSANLGVELTSDEWQDLSLYICDDLSKGGHGRWTPDAAKTLSPGDQNKLADLNLDGAILSDCPDAQGLPEWKSHYLGSPLSASLAYSDASERQSRELEYQKMLLNYDRKVIEYGRKYHVDTTFRRPQIQGGRSGYTVTCNDGSVSQSGGKQGACSHHGGVSG